MKRGLIFLGLIVGLAFAMGWNPPTGSVHSFTGASDYRAEKESGCTNSGEGCHGSEESYKDFNAYHPNAECTTCHKYQGVGCIPCHSDSSQHECPVCHDGSVDRVSDRVRLSDPYPKGHYRETSHTALGTDMTHEVLAAVDGEAKAACEDCHSRDLKKAHTGVPAVAGSTYGPDIGCGECHNDVRQSGQAEVLADWKSRTCESCHKLGTDSAVHATGVAGVVKATGPLGCGQTGSGCHPVDDLHEVHADKPVSCAGSATAGEPGCHNLEIESHAPTVTVCGGTADAACHRGLTNTSLTHEKDAEVHSPTTRVPAEDTSFQDVACGDCHRIEPDGHSLIDEHDVWTSERKNRPGDVCRDCHNDPASAVAVADDWEVRDTVYACEACHGAEGLDAAHPHELGPLHSAADGSEGCASTGAGCHPADDLLEVGEPTIKANIHATCLRCHDWREADGNGPYDPRRSTCGEGRDCHGGADEYNTATGVHDGAAGLADGVDEEHHTAAALFEGAAWADPKTGTSTACARCHSAVLGTEHARFSASLSTGAGTLCERCHNDGPTAAVAVKAGWPGKGGASACAACHGKTGVPVAHGSIDTSHQGLELKLDGSYSLGACARAGCHITTELRQLHSKTGCTPAGCHSATGDVFGSGKRTCGGGVAAGACHPGYTETGGGHTSITIIHAPRGTAQASDTSFHGVTCGACHDIRANGTSLIDEHSLLTATRTVVPGDTCLNCHNAAGAAAAIADHWTLRESTSACAACHRVGGMPLPHTGDMTALHISTSAGCASSGGGCHPGDLLSDIATPTPVGGLHSACLRCHDYTASGSNLAYDPTKKTCGSGRDCHGTAGQYDPATFVHDGTGGSANGTDAAHHTGGDAQRVATYTDSVSGLSTPCWRCHSMVLGTEHGRPNSVIGTLVAGPGPICQRCHDDSATTMNAVKASWPSKETVACGECHGKSGVAAMHQTIDTSHTAVERAPNGIPTPGFCVRPGCHISADVRVVHKYSPRGCAISRCHGSTGNIFVTGLMSCGGTSGPPASLACHRRTNENLHLLHGTTPVSHAAEVTWTIAGTPYMTSALGCFGCHPNDLTSIHSTALIAGSMEGGGATRCSVCHEHVMPPRGTFATATAVQDAIDAGNRRCDACHASGNAVDGPDAVASAHKDTTSTDPLPEGKVWTDPYDDWRTAFDALTGGGHNALPYQFVGAGQDKAFPVTTFTVGASTYVWSLPPNSGRTLWLDPAVYPSATDTDAIQHLRVTCDDCHVIPTGMSGPHGASVRVSIDPAYSQTEYSDPTTNAYQFEPTNAANPAGYQPVVCFKCHTIEAGSVPGTTAPGGVSRHKTHWKYSHYTTTTAGVWGAKCIDCHVRVPHAWRRPRLLIRTVATAGVTPDAFPYVASSHTGLVGIKLQSYSGLSMSPSTCAQNGCFNSPRTTFHPTAAQIPTAAFWP